ncbi:MAG TPA: hypothetical protein VMW62_00820 [Chloroflexota bacterium]|nr:hypothetical protein [Chloroflexota bacterium]
MAKHSNHIMEFARRGAEARYHELQNEIAALIKSFPHLRSQKKRPGLAELADRATETIRKRRKRKAMSAAARKAVSARMKKYWAARRKAKA